MASKTFTDTKDKFGNFVIHVKGKASIAKIYSYDRTTVIPSLESKTATFVDGHTALAFNDSTVVFLGGLKASKHPIGYTEGCWIFIGAQNNKGEWKRIATLYFENPF